MNKESRRRLGGLGLVLLGTNIVNAGAIVAGAEVINKIQAQRQPELIILFPGAVVAIAGYILAKHGGSRLQDPKR